MPLRGSAISLSAAALRLAATKDHFYEEVRKSGKSKSSRFRGTAIPGFLGSLSNLCFLLDDLNFKKFACDNKLSNFRNTRRYDGFERMESARCLSYRERRIPTLLAVLCPMPVSLDEGRAG
jgi:hypothetical protein